MKQYRIRASRSYEQKATGFTYRETEDALYDLIQNMTGDVQAAEDAFMMPQWTQVVESVQYLLNLRDENR